MTTQTSQQEYATTMEPSTAPPPADRGDQPRRRTGSPPAPPGATDDEPAELTEFQRAVAAVVAALEPGELLTYGEVALESGNPGAAQAVANVLRRVPDLPWWRVVPADGRLYFTHAPTQARLLRAEGVDVDERRRIRT